MEVHGSRALQAPQVSLETEESTQIHSFASLEATSSATQRPSLPIEQNPSAVRQTSLTVGRDSNNSSNSDIASRILQKKARIQELIQQHRPGRSVENFFAFYGQRERAMAATRSSIRQGLREAPRANLPFVPDTAPVRQTRSVAQPATSQQGNPFSYTPTSHAAAVEGSNIVDGEFGDIDSFEGQDSRQVPMSIRDVPTPGNRPVQFSRRAGKNLKEPNFYDPYFPLENFEYREGFNIYRHVHFGLRSGIPVEVDFALFHLARMSYTHGDKFRLEGFPLMMEALMEKAMEITQLCTGVMWEFERDQYEWPRKCHRPNVLNTLWGTSDILQRIRTIPITLPNDTLVDEKFSHHLRNINEATLALRNLCLTPENAEYVANYAKGLIRDFLCVMINVPDQPRFNELKNNALDIAEEVTRFMTTASYDPLCISLYRCVKSPDRKHILSAVWAIVHFSSEVADAKNGALVNVGHKYVADLVTYTLCQPDPAMLSITMDYFYQYTLEPTNVEYLVKLVNMSTMFIPRMITLLSYEAVEQVIEIEEQPEVLGPAPTGIPKVPPELSSKLMALAEPERSSHWLRCCFVEDPGCEITQIALWQAYQQRFGAPQPGSGSLAAADFIKNVSATFTNAQAQVVPATGPNGQPTTKFIIKGIRPLETVLTFDGWPYLYCKWSVGEKPGHSCDHAFAEPRDLREHVFLEHMDLEALEQPNQYNYDKAKQSPKACRWDNCTRYKTPNTEVEMVVEHVGGHLPQDRDPDAQPPFPKRRVLQQRVARIERYHDTPVNENNEPVGVAYKAALILRNLLWHLPEDITMKKRMPTVLKKEFFASRYPILADKSVENRSLRVPLSDVVMLIGEYQGLGEDH